jgi:hypothetical protein
MDGYRDEQREPNYRYQQEECCRVVYQQPQIPEEHSPSFFEVL